MHKIHVAWILLVTMISTSYAQNEPLRIATTYFSPPFVMQDSSSKFHGFDVDMMAHICRAIKRDCQFQSMQFSQLLNAVETKQVDVAVNALTITPERSQRVNFSTPYLASNSRFLAPSAMSDQPFNLKLFDNKRIGVQAGSIFETQINLMNIKNSTIIAYPNTHELVDALSTGNIDFTLMDAPSAHYWHLHSSGILQMIGEPLPYGIGFGIAVNKDEPLLLAINAALIIYLQSPDFKKSRAIYLDEFS